MTELLNALPKELIDQFDKIEYQEDGGIVISSVQSLGNNLQVDFTLSFGSYDIPKQAWRIDIKEIKKEKIIIEWASYPVIYSDHCLLYDFLDNYSELYFNSKADNPERLFIDLYKTHVERCDKWIDFGVYINAPEGIEKLCDSDSGLLASGPKRILEQYGKCLKIHGVKTKFIGEVPCDNKTLKLLILGNSFFIGADFEFKRLK